MKIFMIISIILAYAILFYLVLKCNSMINKTCKDGITCRDVINEHNR